jgi:hypothetical protein
VIAAPIIRLLSICRRENTVTVPSESPTIKSIALNPVTSYNTIDCIEPLFVSKTVSSYKSREVISKHLSSSIVVKNLRSFTFSSLRIKIFPLLVPIRMSFSSLSSSRNGLPTVRQMMGSSNLRFHETSKLSCNPSAVIRGRFEVCDIFGMYREKLQKIDRLIDDLKVRSHYASRSHHMATKPVFLAHSMKKQPSINTFKAITIPSVQKFHSLANCLYRESKTPSVEAIENDLSSTLVCTLTATNVSTN